MRKDVNKVLTECYKEGSGRHFKFPRRTTQKLFDETGGKVGMRHEHVRTSKHGTKSFGENLSYLPRFLTANVGRKWDDVYSEIAKTFDKRSTVNAHIFQHLFDYFVPAHEVEFVGNRPHKKVFFRHWQRNESGYVLYPIYAKGYKGLYVDPRTGILKEGMKPNFGQGNPKEAKAQQRKQRELAQKRVLSPSVEMHKREDGFWYVFELRKLPERVVDYVFNEPFPKTYAEQEVWFANKKRFDKLPMKLKVVEGRRVEKRPEFEKFDGFVPYGYQSPLTQDEEIRLKAGKHREYKKIPATHYYASMRSASKKELRSVGL